MAGKNLAPPLLDEADAAFIQGGVTINACSCTRDITPVMTRATGCRVSPDRRKIALFFRAANAEEFLEGIRIRRQIAVVFSEPSTHRTIQIKGRDTAPVSVCKADIERIEAYGDAIVAAVCPLGFDESLVRAVMWFDRNDMIAVEFTASEAFLQTPGPRAGEPLKGANANAG
jgi:hypothetical protein